RAGGPVAEAGAVGVEPMADVVALQRLRGLVGTEEPHPLGGVALGLVAAVVRIGHVVILSSGPPRCVSPSGRPDGRAMVRVDPILHARPPPVVANATSAPVRAAGVAASHLEQLLLLHLEG